jgi:radical SAM superfamily enzyme YgiQ (UPF0313 family)
MQKKKYVLLIFALNPKKSFGTLFPLGLSYIGTVLEKAGHSVEILDMNVYRNPYKVLEKRLQKQDYDCVGISMRDFDFNPRHLIAYIPIKLDYRNSPIHSFIHTTRIIRKYKGDKLLIAGGAGFSIMPKRIIEVSEVDVGVQGEGEEIFVELMQNLKTPEKVKGIYIKKKGKIFHTGYRPLIKAEKLNVIPKRDLPGIPKDLRVYGMGVQTMRGCPFKCLYCTYSLIQGCSIRLKKTETTLKELEILRYNYNVREITFADCIFAHPRKHAEAIVNGVIKKKIDIKWKAEVRVDAFDRDFLAKMVRSGCYRLDFSPESGSDRILKILQKEVTSKQIIDSFKLLRKHEELETWYYMMFNSPGETWSTAWESIKLVSKLYRMGLAKHGRALFSVIRIYPNTMLERIALKEGMITPKTDLLLPVFYNPYPINILNFFAIFVYNPIAFPDFARFYLTKQKFKLSRHGSSELSHSYKGKLYKEQPPAAMRSR